MGGLTVSTSNAPNPDFNDFGKLRCSTERRRDCVDAYLDVAAAIVILRVAGYLYRQDTRARSPQIC